MVYDEEGHLVGEQLAGIVDNGEDEVSRAWQFWWLQGISESSVKDGGTSIPSNSLGKRIL